MVDEARLYRDKLSDLSNGTGCVPRSYGVYQVVNYRPHDSDDLSFGCMIIEDCGVPARSLLDSGYADEVLFCTRLVVLVYELHKRGVAHRQIEDRHVLQKDGWPYIVDFSKATFDHDCPRKSDNLDDRDYDGGTHPLAEESGCRDIYEVYQETGMWLPMNLRCDGYFWTASVFVDNPWALTDKLLDGGSLHDEMAPQYAARQALTLAHEAICDYCRKYLPARGVEYEDDIPINIKLEKYCREYENEVAWRSPLK
ncbi:unnamed protein product [Peniophora sp. CBMAI 1063]|nr:unnamed protein product [Peniophora sp. CBMAI 1063]